MNQNKLHVSLSGADELVSIVRILKKINPAKTSILCV